MKRTFKGFLKAYCSELAGLKTESLKKLLNEAENSPRVVEPLFCLALETGKLTYLTRLAKGTHMEQEWNDLAKSARRYRSAERWLTKADIPKRYKKVLEAYKSQGDLLAADRRIVSLMREKTLDALEASGKTRYGVCKALELNKGNFYAYLAGDNSKVSRDTARRILNYVQNLYARLLTDCHLISIFR